MVDTRARKVALLMPSRAQRVFTTLLHNVEALVENVYYFFVGWAHLLARVRRGAAMLGSQLDQYRLESLVERGPRFDRD